MTKTLYERDMEDSLRQIADALGVDVLAAGDVGDVIRAAVKAGKDAKRYRWLRAATEVDDTVLQRGSAEELDATIDAELAPTTPPPHKRQHDGS